MFRVLEFRCKLQALREFKVQGSGSRVQGSGFRVQGLGLEAKGKVRGLLLPPKPRVCWRSRGTGGPRSAPCPAAPGW